MCSSQERKVLFIGDSILRDLEDYVYHLDVNYEYNVLCLPGAKVNDLKHFVKKHFNDIVYEEETTHIVVHVGTNNLKNGLWERDRHDYVELINTLTELFRSANIIFSAILPRWDCDELYDKSLYFNIQLEQLCARLGCKYVDLSNDILELDNGFYRDGLHLSARGKAFFSYSLDLFLIHCFEEKNKLACKSRSWLPKELKKLWTPKPEKPKKEQQKDTDRDSFINKRRERKKKWLPRRRRRPNSRKLPNNYTPVAPDGYVLPRKVSFIKPPPQLPPNRHIAEKVITWIPYTNLHVPISKLKTSQVNLPSPRKPYVKRKNSKRQTRRKDRTAHRRKKKKVCCLLKFKHDPFLR